MLTDVNLTQGKSIGHAKEHIRRIAGATDAYTSVFLPVKPMGDLAKRVEKYNMKIMPKLEFALLQYCEPDQKMDHGVPKSVVRYDGIWGYLTASKAVRTVFARLFNTLLCRPTMLWPTMGETS